MTIYRKGRKLLYHLNDDSFLDFYLENLPSFGFKSIFFANEDLTDMEQYERYKAEIDFVNSAMPGVFDVCDAVFNVEECEEQITRMIAFLKGQQSKSPIDKCRQSVQTATGDN